MLLALSLGAALLPAAGDAYEIGGLAGATAAEAEYAHTLAAAGNPLAAAVAFAVTDLVVTGANMAAAPPAQPEPPLPRAIARWRSPRPG